MRGTIMENTNTEIVKFKTWEEVVGQIEIEAAALLEEGSPLLSQEEYDQNCLNWLQKSISNIRQYFKESDEVNAYIEHLEKLFK